MREQPIEKLEWQEVQSSNIHKIAYDPHSQTACVQFIHGGLYSYLGVDEEHYQNFAHSESFGKYLNNVIKSFPYTRWDSEEQLLNHLNV